MDEPGRREPHIGPNPYAAPDDRAGLAPPAAGDSGRYPVEFSAAAGEYFRIWIVNLALTIITLGIYSAWAKVRKKRYFYGHTRIDGDSFEYRANPVAILKGRIIAAILFAGYSFGGKISPVLGVIFALVLGFGMPWLMVRSLAFNARNSAYRNIRFGFDGRHGELFKLLLGGGLLVVITLGIGYPYFRSQMIRFTARHHSYGTTPFELDNITGALYGIFFRALGLLILGFAALGVVAGLLGGFSNVRNGFSAGIAVFVIAAYVTYFLVYAYAHARTTNVTWNSLAIGPLSFESTLGARELAGIYIVNIVAIVFTLGLATPWAVVRTMRYRAEHLTVLAAGGLADFVGAESANVSATGQEVGEMFDFDFGL